MLPVVKFKRPGQKNRIYDTETRISGNPAQDTSPDCHQSTMVSAHSPVKVLQSDLIFVMAGSFSGCKRKNFFVLMWPSLWNRFYKALQHTNDSEGCKVLVSASDLDPWSDTHVTSPCSMMPPNRQAVMWSSLSGYWGKNLYSSNRFRSIHLNTSYNNITRKVTINILYISDPTKHSKLDHNPTPSLE